MGPIKKALGGVIKVVAGTGISAVNAADETLKGDFEYEDTQDSLEVVGDGIVDILSSPFSLLDDEDDDW